MASVNKVIIVGNLGADPEVRTFDNGGKIAIVSVATSERWADRQTGEPREKTEWHRIVFSNRLADIVEQYLRKGSQIYVEGSLTTRKWQDPQTGQDRYSTEIRAQSMQMLGSRNNSDSFGGNDNQNGGYNSQSGYQNNQGGGNYNRGYQNHAYSNSESGHPNNQAYGEHAQNYQQNANPSIGQVGKSSQSEQSSNTIFASPTTDRSNAMPPSSNANDDDIPF